MRYMGNGMVVVVVILTDRLMLANLLDIKEASLFSVASLFPMVLVIVVQGFIFAWQPWCFSRLARHESGDAAHLGLGAAFYLIALPIGACILAWGACWLGPYVIDKQFAQAFTYVFPLMMAMVAQGFYQFAQTILQYYQRLGWLSWIAFVVMALNLVLNFVLIPKMGTIGSAWATCIAYGLAFLMTALADMIILRKCYFTFIKEQARV
jgi:O-antigen/teichoic acid export membrane protein